jgi:hypothetical protein
MRLGEYLSAILQDFTRAEAQAHAFARDLARDIAETPEEGSVPVTRFSFDRSTLTTRIAVAEVSKGTAGDPGTKRLTAAARRTARALTEHDETAELFALSGTALQVWSDAYAPRLQKEFQRTLSGDLSPSAAASVVGAVVAKTYTQFVVDERAEVSDSERQRILDGGQVEELEAAVRKLYRRHLEKGSNADRKEDVPLGPHVEVLVGIDDLSEVEERLLTTIEITLEGNRIRWEAIDDESGELIQL